MISLETCRIQVCDELMRASDAMQLKEDGVISVSGATYCLHSCNLT